MVLVNARADDFQMVDAEKVERSTLLSWLRAYEIEALGAEDTPVLDSKVASRLVQSLDARNLWALIVEGKAVSLSGFNAQLPDMVHGFNQFPWILLEAFQAQANALAFFIQPQHIHLDLITHIQDFTRVLHPMPGQL